MTKSKKIKKLHVHRIEKTPKKFVSDKIVFSFEYIQKGNYCFSILDKKDKSALSEAIFKRKDFTVCDLFKSGRHGLGCEKLALDCIKNKKPTFFSDEIKHYLCLRYNGLKAMVGFLIENIFYILWFDHDFTLYSHG